MCETTKTGIFFLIIKQITMSNSYHLRNDNSEIGIKVKVGTIGNAVSRATRFRSGGSFEDVAKSAKSDASGAISTTKIGISNELIGATIVVDVAILLEGVPKNQLDQAFENLFVRVTLFGGLDVEQFYDITTIEKKQFMDKRLIVASKAIKLITQII